MSRPYDNSFDQELLQEWEQRGDEEAFRELVTRHLGMVHATALRRTGSAEIAREASMSVFALLARRAAAVRHHPCLAGWLHRAAYLEASNALRRELKHSRIMAALSDPAYATPESEEGNALLAAAAPHLDEVLESLSSSDRDAVMMRFTERLSYDAMGARLGKSADACQKQTSRALEKLAAMLLRRGVTLSAAAAGSVITAGTTKAAPVLLTGKVAVGALQQAAGISSLTILQHALHAMNTGKQIAAGALLAGSLAAVPLLIQESKASALAREANAPKPAREAAAPPPPEPAKTSAPSQRDYARSHPAASVAEADATLRMIAALDGRQFSTGELFDLVSRLLDLPQEYMPRTLERILAMKTLLLQPALGVALFARWGELDPEGAMAAISQPQFKKLHAYANDIAQAGINMGMFETNPGALLKLPGYLDMDFLSVGFHNLEPALVKDFLSRAPDHKREQMELEMLFRSDPDNLETAVTGLIARMRADTKRNSFYAEDLARRTAARLAESDPLRALNFAQQTLKDDPGASRRATDAALRVWSAQDTPAAVAWLESQPVEAQLKLVPGLSPALEGMDERALRAFAGGGPAEVRPDRFLMAAEALAAHDPVSASKMVEEALPPKRGHAWDIVADKWAEQDKMKASEWLVSLPPGPDRNSAIAGFTRKLVWEDAESALIWAAGIDDPARRAKVVESRIQVWLSRDRAAATAWLEASEALPAEKKQSLLAKKPDELLLEH